MFFAGVPVYVLKGLVKQSIASRSENDMIPINL